MSELPPVIASSNRFLDIQPYCSFIYSSDPQKWGFILPWEFPQFATREVEEAFLRTWFTEEEIRMQGGAFGEGLGFKFLKQVWYCISLFNLEHRIPAITNMWMERNQHIWTDPAMQQHICRDDVQYSTFFSEEEQREYGKLLHWVIKNIQLRVQQTNNKGDGEEHLGTSKNDGDEHLAIKKNIGREDLANEDLEKLTSSSLPTAKFNPTCEPVDQAISKSAEISKASPTANEVMSRSICSTSAASSSVPDREANQPEKSSDQDPPSHGMNTGCPVLPRKRGNSGSYRRNTNFNVGPGRANQNVLRNPYYTPQFQPSIQFPQPNVGDVYAPTVAQSDMRALSGPAQITGLPPPQFQPTIPFSSGPAFFDSSQQIPVSGASPMISNSGYIGPMPQYQNTFFSPSNLADPKNDRYNTRGLSESIPPPNNQEDFGNAKRGSKRRESISSRGKTRGYYNGRGGRGTYSKNNLVDDRLEPSTFNAGGYIEQSVAHAFPPPHDGCKNEYPTLRRQPLGSHGTWRDRQMQTENLPPRPVFHGSSKDIDQGSQATSMLNLQATKTEFITQAQFQNIVNVSAVHPQDSVRPLGTFFHEESCEGALRYPERVVTKHRIGRDCTHVRKLIAFDVPEDFPVEQIVGHFSRFGPVTNVERSIDRHRREGKYAKHPRNVWVTFENHFTAQVALAHGAALWNGPPIKVEVPREFWDTTHMYYPGHEIHRETARAVSGTVSHPQRPITVKTHHTGISQIIDQQDSNQSTPVGTKFSIESQKMPNEFQSGRSTPTASTTNTPKKSKSKVKTKNKSRQLQKGSDEQISETESWKFDTHIALDKSDDDNSIEKGNDNSTDVPHVLQESETSIDARMPSAQDKQMENSATVSPEGYSSLNSEKFQIENKGNGAVPKSSSVKLDLEAKLEQSIIPSVRSLSQSPTKPDLSPNIRSGMLQSGPLLFSEQRGEIETIAHARSLRDFIGEPSARNETAEHVFEVTDGTVYEDAQAEISLQSKSSASPQKSEADDSFHTASGSPDSDKGKYRSADHGRNAGKKSDEASSTEAGALEEEEEGDIGVKSPSGASTGSLSSSVTITEPNKLLKRSDDLTVITSSNTKDSNQSASIASTVSPTPALPTALNTPSVPPECQVSSNAASSQTKKPEKLKGPAQTESMMGAMFAKPPKQKTKKQKNKKNKRTNENKSGMAAESVGEAYSHAAESSASSSVKDDHSTSAALSSDAVTVHEARKQLEDHTTDVARIRKAPEYTTAPAKSEITSNDQDKSSSKTRDFFSTLFGGNKGCDSALADTKTPQHNTEAAMSKAKQIESATAQGSIPAPMGKPTSSSDNVISIHAEKPFRVDGDQCRDNPICGHGNNGGSGNSRASTDGADDGLDICTADRMGSGAEDTVTDAAKSKKKRKKKKKSGNKRGQMAELEDDDQILITPNLSRETTPGTPGIEWVVPCESGYGSQSVKADVVSEESSHTLGKTPTPDQSPASTVRTMHEPSAIQRKVEAARAKHSSGNVIATPPVRRKKGKRVTSTSAVSTSGAASGRATPTEDCQMMKAIPLLRSTVDSDDEVCTLLKPVDFC